MPALLQRGGPREGSAVARAPHPRKLNFVSVSSVVARRSRMRWAWPCCQAERPRRRQPGLLWDGATSTGDFQSRATWQPCARHPACSSAATTAGPSRPRARSRQSLPPLRKGSRLRHAGRAGRRQRRAGPGPCHGRGRGARAPGRGPTLIEALTYRRVRIPRRMIPRRYRDPAELLEWECRDPIRRFVPTSKARAAGCGRERSFVQACEQEFARWWRRLRAYPARRRLPLCSTTCTPIGLAPRGAIR